MVSLRKVAQHNKAENFGFVPMLDMSVSYSDAELYERFGLSDHEIEFIEANIREMNFDNV